MVGEADGDTLYAWQSEDHPGRWSIIASIFATREQVQRAVTAGDPSLLPEQRLMVLVHRDREVAEAFRPLAEMHHGYYKQRIRFVRFRVAEWLDGIE